MDFTKDIYINKEKICEDQEFVLLYKGELFSKDLSKEVYMSYGYGSNWETPSEVQMKPSTFGYLATIKAGSGKELQFVFRDNQGNWDNNSYQNYKIPVYESEEAAAFKPVIEDSKEIPLEIISETDNNEEDFSVIFEPEIIEINEVDLYNTVDLDSITKQAIPDNTVYTRVDLDSEEVTSEVVQSPIETEQVDVAFSKLDKEPAAATTFSEDTISTGDVYVNTIVKDIPKKVESAEKEKALVKVPDSSLTTRAGSALGSLFATIKTAFAKVAKLIKTAFDFDSDENEN